MDEQQAKRILLPPYEKISRILMVEIPESWSDVWYSESKREEAAKRFWEKREHISTIVTIVEGMNSICNSLPKGDIVSRVKGSLIYLNEKAGIIKGLHDKSKEDFLEAAMYFDYTFYGILTECQLLMQILSKE